MGCMLILYNIFYGIYVPRWANYFNSIIFLSGSNYDIWLFPFMNLLLSYFEKECTVLDSSGHRPQVIVIGLQARRPSVGDEAKGGFETYNATPSSRDTDGPRLVSSHGHVYLTWGYLEEQGEEHELKVPPLFHEWLPIIISEYPFKYINVVAKEVIWQYCLHRRTFDKMTGV